MSPKNHEQPRNGPRHCKPSNRPQLKTGPGEDRGGGALPSKAILEPVLTAKNGTGTFTRNSPATARLILHPRLTRRGYRYDVEYLGELIVVGSADPEHDAARVLLAYDITGVAETVDANTGKPRMRFGIEHFAATRTVERRGGGLSTEPWQPMPSGSSHPRSPTRVSKAGGGDVADSSERPSAPPGGNSE